jgi:hypothetical protein
MKKQLYYTFMAVSMTVEEMLQFFHDFSELECTSWTKTTVTYGETNPRLVTLAVHVEAEQDYLLKASFKDGQLHRAGWSERFTLLPNMTSAEDIGTNFIEPKLPSAERLAQLNECICADKCDCARPNPGPGLIGLFSQECPIHNEDPEPNPSCRASIHRGGQRVHHAIPD